MAGYIFSLDSVAALRNYVTKGLRRRTSHGNSRVRPWRQAEPEQARKIAQPWVALDHALERSHGRAAPAGGDRLQHPDFVKRRWTCNVKPALHLAAPLTVHLNGTSFSQAG